MITWNYIAGFFDGEGSITHNGKGYRLTISQTNLDVLNQIKQFSKIGHVISITKRQTHWKDAWVYYVAKQKEVHFFLHQILPHLIVKNTYSKKILRELKDIIIKQNKHAKLTKWYKLQTKILRQRGLSYREIGKKLGIDWGYARRIYLKTQK